MKIPLLIINYIRCCR